jgi:hypothetical protein
MQSSNSVDPPNQSSGPNQPGKAEICWCASRMQPGVYNIEQPSQQQLVCAGGCDGLGLEPASVCVDRGVAWQR